VMQPAREMRGGAMGAALLPGLILMTTGIVQWSLKGN
jgi:hypothetical protein